MSSTTKRLIAAAVAFGALLVLVLVVANQGGPEDEPAADEPTTPLPEIAKDDVTRLEVIKPDGPEIILVREDDDWRLTEPLDADANDNLVQLALNKLAEMREADTGIAATKAANHERLEVAESNGLQVVAKAGGKTVAHLFIGAFKAGNTLVRAAGEEPVHAVSGSLKSNFNRDTDGWREKRVVDETASEVAELRFESDNGSFHFVRGEDDQWKPAEGQEPIEDFDPSRVQSVASALARMRATGFAEPGTTPKQAGAGENASTAVLVVDREEGEPERIVLRLGNALGGNERFFLVREDREPVYVVSKHLAERIAPEEKQFQPSDEPEEPPPGGQPKKKMSKQQLQQLMKQIQKTPIRMGGP